MDAFTIAGAVPLTTISMICILFVMKRDVFLEILDMQSAYYNISQFYLIVLSAIVVAAIMIICSAIYMFIQWYLQQRRQQQALQQVHEAERAALITVFNALNGRKWTDKTCWCSSEPLHRWKGVKLNPETKRVNKLILPDNDLEGEIPEEIGVLQELKELDFRRNKISGPIPDTLQSLRKLEGLYLYENYMTGEIPMALSDFPNLAGIYLFNNQFTNAAECAEVFREKLPPECYVFI